AATMRRALYGPSAALAGDLLSVGRVLSSLGRTGEAITVLNEGAQLARTYLGPTSQQSVMFGVYLAEAHADLGELAAARAALDGVAPAARALGPDHLLYGAYLRGRGQLRTAEGQFDAAEADYEAAEAIF